MDALSPLKSWYDTDVVGIDVGITMVMAENARTGYIWKIFNGEPGSATWNTEGPDSNPISRVEAKAFCLAAVGPRELYRWPGAPFSAVVGLEAAPASAAFVNRVRRGKKGVTSKGILSRAVRMVAGAALIIST